MKRDPTVEAFDELAALRSAPSLPQLQKFLGHKSNLVVAKAAKLAGELRLEELAPDLVKAFHRLQANPGKLDPGCAGLTEIIRALSVFESTEVEIYRFGIQHIQMEAAYGGPVDTAGRLRSLCALAIVRTRDPGALAEVTNRLVDSLPGVRTDAARALGYQGSETAELLLRLKVLTGDREPEVIGECFAGILATGSESGLAFVKQYLEQRDEDLAEAAVVALGACRRPEALAALREKWERTAHGDLRRTLLLAFATAREESAIDFLLALLATENQNTAVQVIAALAMARGDERIQHAVERTLRQRGDAKLLAVYESEFRTRIA